MDTASIVAIVVACLAAIPGIWGIYNSGKKDKQQMEIDRQTVIAQAQADARNALMGMIDPLRAEVDRLQKRVAELEGTLSDKNGKINTLEQAVFDRDVKIRTMQYTLDGLKMRLESVENSTAITPSAKKAIRKLRLETENTDVLRRKAIEEVSAELNFSLPNLEIKE